MPEVPTCGGLRRGVGQSQALVQSGQTSRVFVVGGFEEIGGALFADERAGGEDLRRLTGGGEAGGDFGFEAVDQHATTDGGSRGDGGVEAVHMDHGVADGGAGIEDQVGEVLEFQAIGALAGAGFGMETGDDGHDLEAAPAEAFGHFHGDDVAAAGGDDEGGVLGAEVEVAKDAIGEAGDIFEEHGLALAVRADDEVVEAEGEFDDGVEAGEGTVTRPDFLDQNPAMAGAEEVDHASGADGIGEPIGGLSDFAELTGDGGQ